MKKGDKVICVDDKHQAGDTPCVVEGKIYTIRGISPISTGLYLEEIHLDHIRPGIERAFRRVRFREIDDWWAEEVLGGVLEKVREEVFELVGG